MVAGHKGRGEEALVFIHSGRVLLVTANSGANLGTGGTAINKQGCSLLEVTFWWEKERNS